MTNYIIILEITCDGDVGGLPAGGILDGEVQVTYAIGETVSFTCVIGYTLVGTNSATCGSNGFFSQITFECKGINFANCRLMLFTRDLDLCYINIKT